ncbi:MAG: hypothetical protein GY829_02480 [Gammaproteobacteria bacterium]|nr:hypothetical protein [Gammaproteobacteria bacterium]
MATLIKLFSFLLLSISSNLLAVTWTYTENSTGVNLLALGYPVPSAIDSMTAVDGFRTYDSLHAQHQALMINSDNITGTIVGKTYNKRDIWAYSLSDPDNTTVEGIILEGAVLQNGGIHAREWSTPEVTTGIMERLASNEDDQWLYQYLLENINIVIQPVENIDGFLQTQRYPTEVLQSTYAGDPSTWPRDGRMRRKNMRNVDEDLNTSNDAMLGIDLNRNNSPFWNTSTGSSANNQSLVFHGSSTASEPETLSLQASAALGPTNRLRFYVDTHSFSQLWYMPNTGNDRRDNLANEVGNLMLAATNDRYTLSSTDSSSGIGSTDEYFAHTYQIPSYTLETEPTGNGAVQYGGSGVSHDGFILPEAEISRVREELADASVIAWYMQSGPAALLAVEIRDTDSDTIVYAGNWSTTSTTSRIWTEETNAGLSSSGNYRIWAAYNKPMRWLDGQQAVSNFTSLNISLPPTITLEGLSSGGEAFSQLISGTNNDWLQIPGGAGQGYLNYKTDAFMIDFTLSDTIDPATSTLLALAFSNQDITGRTNDADPSTVIDWNTFWINYEDSTGDTTDVGGIDRTLRIVDNGNPDFFDPATNNNSSTDNNNNSSGGGTTSWLILVLIIIGIIQRSKFTR